MTQRLRLTALLLASAGVLTACGDRGTETPDGATTGGQARSVVVPYEEPVLDPDAVLELQDQARGGENVLVDAVAVTQGGFVAVVTRDGRNTYGVGYVTPGTEPQELIVNLGEDADGVLDLVAHLYADVNGDGFFDAGDVPVARQAGRDTNGFPGEAVEFTLTLDE